MISPALRSFRCLWGKFLVLLSRAEYGQGSGGRSVVIAQQHTAPLLPSQGTIPSPMAIGRRHEHHPFPAVRKVGAAVRDFQSGDSSELAPRLPYKGKSVRNRGVSQTMPFLVIPRSLLRGGFIAPKRGCKTRPPNRRRRAGAAALLSHAPLSASLCPSRGRREGSRSHPPWHRNVMPATEPLRSPPWRKDKTEATSSLNHDHTALEKHAVAPSTAICIRMNSLQVVVFFRSGAGGIP